MKLFHSSSLFVSSHPFKAAGLETLDHFLIGTVAGRSAMVAGSIPVATFFAVAGGMSQAQVGQVVCATQNTWENMLDISAKAVRMAKGKATIADQTFARPLIAHLRKGLITLGNLAH